MANWFKRSDGAAAKEPPRPPTVHRPRPAPKVDVHASPAPLPEVVAEGNTQADWSAWEDSMTALDSQFQGLDPSTRVQVRDTRPSQLEEPDAFANLARRRDL